MLLISMYLSTNNGSNKKKSFTENTKKNCVLYVYILGLNTRRRNNEKKKIAYSGTQVIPYQRSRNGKKKK